LRIFEPNRQGVRSIHNDVFRVSQRVLRLLRTVPHYLGRHVPILRIIFGCCVRSYTGTDRVQHILSSDRAGYGNDGGSQPCGIDVLVERLP
jgi:hypothetical protein